MPGQPARAGVSWTLRTLEAGAPLTGGGFAGAAYAVADGDGHVHVCEFDNAVAKRKLHEGAILAVATDEKTGAILTAGDDGKAIRIRPDGEPETLHDGRKWVDTVACSPRGAVAWSAGKSVFLDMKLLDIDNTIARGVESVVGLGIDMLTIHAYPKAMTAAVEAAQGTSLTLLGVTVMTSMDDHDLSNAGYHDSAAALVLKRARQARDAGMRGIVCSAAEADSVRDITGPDMAIVTPGIRPAGSAVGDQKRVVTPADAISAGASHLVVGRPITAASDLKSAAGAIIDEIAETI